jgi:hypothetical protein
MYENIKYEELKNLPDEQKKEALQELMATYGSNKAIAEATEGYATTIANMYSKYVEGKHIGRVKGSKNPDKKPKEENKVKRKYTKKVKEDTIIPIESPQEEIVYNKVLEEVKTSTLSFNSSLSGDLSGEEVKVRIIGIVNALLDDKTYSVNLQIDEK